MPNFSMSSSSMNFSVTLPQPEILSLSMGSIGKVLPYIVPLIVFSKLLAINTPDCINPDFLMPPFGKFGTFIVWMAYALVVGQLLALTISVPLRINVSSFGSIGSLLVYIGPALWLSWYMVRVTPDAKSFIRMGSLTSFLALMIPAFLACRLLDYSILESSIVFFLVVWIFVHIATSIRCTNVKRIKWEKHYTNNRKSYKDMSVREAQAIYRNLAEVDFPFLFEFGWIVEFFKTATVPCLSKVIVKSGHFCSLDPLVSHKRQQDTVCLMTAMQAQVFGCEYHALTMARINEHHNRWGALINSDTVLYLSWMWFHGPVQWINNFGWRKLEDFEVHALFVLWRELSVMLGCKWVPYTLEEFEHFRQEFAKVATRPSKYNVQFSDAIMDAVLFSVPGILKSLARKCVIAILDDDVVYCNKYTDEYSPRLRKILFHVLQAWGMFQYYLCFPRLHRRILTPTSSNKDSTVNFPTYTFPATPYYVRPTAWNRWGPLALLNRLRGLPVPGPEFGGNGVNWESMGAVIPNPEKQSQAEGRVIANCKAFMKYNFGYRPVVNFQRKPIVVTPKYGIGYGWHVNTYKIEDVIRKATKLELAHLEEDNLDEA